MSKRWIFVLSVALALGLIGLLAYTSESVHRRAEPAPRLTEPARSTVAPAREERETGPMVHRNGLMLTH